MTTCSDLAEYEWLTGSEAGAILEELAADKTPLHTAIERLRGRVTQNQTHLLIEQADLRRRAAAKFSQAHRMFFTRIGLEQATDEWVARYKALRIAQRVGARAPSAADGRPPMIGDLCTGIGGDLIALAKCSQAVGVDRDNVIAHFATINAGTDVSIKEVADFNLNGFTAFHIDPDRRPAGHRTTLLEWCEPGLATIERLLNQVPHAAVKLAPACVVPDDWTARCELEWISRDRECRQLVAWHGNLADAPGQHHATILKTACGLAPRTITGHPKQPIEIAERPDRFVFDIDPAVLAAKLKGVLAAEHQLKALSDGPTYLTGPKAVEDAALVCFEVDDVMPMRVRTLAQYLRERGIGQLEIKKRGVEVDPERLRKDLRLSGDNQATLLITNVAGRPTAIIARRVQE